MTNKTCIKNNNGLAGIFWILLAGILYSAMGGLLKYLGGTVPVYQMAFMRCLLGMCILSPYILKNLHSLYPRGTLKLHSIRIVCGTTSLVLAFYAYSVLPLANAISAMFSRVLFMVVLSVFFLGEKPTLVRVFATVAGFAGVLLVLQPSAEGLTLGAWACLGASSTVAVAMVAMKKLSVTQPSTTLVVTFIIPATLILSVPAAQQWVPLSLNQFLLLLAMAGASTAGHFCAIRSYSLADASLIAPFDYIQILYGVAIGLVWFGEMPDLLTWTGAAIIVTASLMIVRETNKKHKEQSKSLPKH